MSADPTVFMDLPALMDLPGLVEPSALIDPPVLANVCEGFDLSAGPGGLTGQRLGHYVLQGLIGVGGMSAVYRAVDSRLDRPVAIKVMRDELCADPEFRARFGAEARAAAAVDHLNVVPLYDFGDDAGRLFIVMRLVEGTDLARESAHGPMGVRRTFALLGQVAAALDTLHDQGLIHLDITPANVLITRRESAGEEHVYLADFGLSRRVAAGDRPAPHQFLGSPAFASPEHLRGLPVRPASDRYSLACLLFAALAGRPPFVGDLRSVITGQLRGRAPSLAALTGLPRSLDRVIARGMSADPDRRYPSSAALLAAAQRSAGTAFQSRPHLSRPLQSASAWSRSMWSQPMPARPALGLIQRRIQLGMVARRLVPRPVGFRPHPSQP